ncbi:hypothetical protein HYPSUDRAFT_44952 [Hypholoma sublateritium FD-334 SS-4]|uniref:DUF6534 domain-containing protein n=1 Tax=Hypholoma sublateritium (strain FD-334 SS-4) TaxID=945553 RepID=A0A0D2PF20_HYPSF|nr:hypothetical protein HYPSUDRAFT_44952 [Hypholoma sublateritium FD-334 SS-4]
MASIPPVVIEVDLNNTIGAIEIGSLFGVFLFGIVTLQTFNYYDNYKEDGWGNKTLVACIWFLEIGHTLGINFELYRATIILYGQPWELVRFPGIAAVTVVGGAITLITQVRPFHYHFTPPCGLTILQVFFSLRLTKLLPRPYHHIGSIAIVISSLRFVTSIYLTVEGVILPNITVYREKCQWIVSAMFISSALVDIIIAVSMLYYLTRQRKQVKRISRLLDRLVTYTIRSGLLTSIAAIAVILCFLLMPANFVWLGVYTFVAKLYSNSLLSAYASLHTTTRFQMIY